MKAIFSPQKYAVYLLFFSLNFETMNLFNLGIDFLATKISISILLFTSILKYRTFFSLKHFHLYLIPLLIYFVFLTIVSYVNQVPGFNKFFNIPLFLNILIFIILINYSRIKSEIILEGLFVFAISTVLLSTLYFSGIGVNNPVNGRNTIFGNNPNDIGIKLCLSILIFSAVIFENKLELGKGRYFLLIFFPFLIKFLIDTNSRVAFIAFVLGIFIMFRIYYKFTGGSRKLNLLISGGVFSVLVLLILLINMDILVRLYNVFAKGDLSKRDWIWSNIWKIISNNFFFGIGKTGYDNQSVLVFGRITNPHNSILEVLCYTGIIGLMIFLIFFWRILKGAYVKYKYQNNVLPVILAIPIMGVFLSAQIFEPKIIWVLFAFMAAQKSTEGNQNLKVIKV